MSTGVALLVDHGYAVLFVYVLVALLGAPLPSTPLLVTAGALVATGRLALGPAVGVVVVACLLADSAWYWLGRSSGDKVLHVLCRIALEPEACVRKSEDAIARYGPRFLLVAKFLPGVGLMAAPTVGQSKLRYLRFAAFDAVGALLWAAAYILLGCLLARSIEHNARFLHLAARFAGLAVVGAAVSLFLARLVRRHRFRRRFAAARITPEQLR